jgi:hypothetical protein
MGMPTAVMCEEYDPVKLPSYVPALHALSAYILGGGGGAKLKPSVPLDWPPDDRPLPDDDPLPPSSPDSPVAPPPLRPVCELEHATKPASSEHPAIHK